MGEEEGEVMMGSYKNDSKLISFFRARVSYDYEGKYLFTAFCGLEGSSKFRHNHKCGNFPGRFQPDGVYLRREFHMKDDMGQRLKTVQTMV